MMHFYFIMNKGIKSRTFLCCG